MKKNNTSFINLLEKSVSPFHTVLAVRDQLTKVGFEELSEIGSWKLMPGGSYYVCVDGSTLIAFVLGQRYAGARKLRMAAAHTDFPCLVIKQHPDMICAGCQQLNVEVYGGPILNTWLDRPLSAAGQVVLKSEDPWHPEVRLVDFQKPFCVIPNLAIHMNREVNKGVALNRQTDMIPIAGLAGEEQDKEGFMQFLADRMGVKKEDILDYALYLYVAEKPETVGMQEDLLSACHLDNTTGVQALLTGIVASAEASAMAECFNCPTASLEGIRLAAFFDHEEIGSKTKKGAASMVLRTVLNKIAQAEGLVPEFWSQQPSAEQLLEDAMLLSVDVGHGAHPNNIGKLDPTNKAILGKGFCIKQACAQSYATDSAATGILKQLCDKKNIPWQIFMNRSDEAGGSTLGAVSAGFLPIPMVEIGVPILAMHSVRELMAICDMDALADCVSTFFVD